MKRPTTAVLVLSAISLSLVLAPLAALAEDTTDDSGDEPRWIFGRTPDVFRPIDPVFTTRIGGWLDASYEDNDLDDSTRSINLNHANLFFDTRYRDAWQAFLEVEFEYESNLGGYEKEREYELEQAYLRYRWTESLQLRLGTFNTTFGYWTPVHWSILMDTIQPPLHEGLRYAPEQQTGAELSGHLFPGELFGRDAEVRYVAYAGYGDDSALLDGSDTDGLSVGSDLRLTLDEDSFVGVTAYRQKRDLPASRVERNLVLYAQVALPARLTLRGEYVHQNRDSDTLPGLTRHANVSYAKLRWDFHRTAYLNYRFNWGDDDSSGVTDRHYVHTATLGYRPRPPVRIKLEWADHGFRGSAREDFHYWGLSVGYLF